MGSITRLVKSRETLYRTLGLAGGIAGLVGVLVAIVANGLDFVLVINDENIEISRALVGMSWGMMGALGGIMSWSNPTIPGLLMLISGIAGLITIPAYFSVGGILLIIGAVLALATRASTGPPPQGRSE